MGGLTDRARAGLYGETATRNHSGGYRIAGEVAGTAASYAVGKGAGARTARVAGRALDAVDAARILLKAVVMWVIMPRLPHRQSADCQTRQGGQMTQQYRKNTGSNYQPRPIRVRR